MACGRSRLAMTGTLGSQTPSSSPPALTVSRTASSAPSRPLTALTATKSKADDFQPGSLSRSRIGNRTRSLNQRLRGADDDIQFHRRSTNSNLNPEREPGLNSTKQDNTFSIRVHNRCFTRALGVTLFVPCYSRLASSAEVTARSLSA